jgi:hypothetical protein
MGDLGRGIRLGRAVGLCLLLGAATLLGGLRVAALLGTPDGPLTVSGGDARFTVTHVEQVAGLTDSDLDGMSHGVQSLVPDGQALIRVDLTVTAGDSETAYDATRLEAVAVGAAGGIVPVAGSLPLRGRLAAHASLEGSLSYVVPRNGSRLVLQAGSREIPLGSVDEATATGHHHFGAVSTSSPSTTPSLVAPMPPVPLPLSGTSTPNGP